MSAPRPIVAVRDRRVYVPLAEVGCGVGCAYCYIGSPRAKGRPLPPLEVQRMLESLIGEHAWRPGPEGPLIVIGCDTELGISTEMVTNALICLEFAQNHALPVQFATKFPLPEVVRDKLDGWPSDRPHPIVFTTITTVRLAARVEPGAPPPAERTVNFAPHGDAWRSYALVKPFLAHHPGDRRALAGLLARARPDGVVVGMRYRRATRPVGGAPHPVASGWFAVTLPEPARSFLTDLHRTGLRVFVNTQCVSAWHNGSTHGEVIKSTRPELCVSCGACP